MEDSGENWFRIFMVYRNMGHEERRQIEREFYDVEENK